jgi:hypothetical protein
MSSPSREHLLGYLLGALERTEHEQVEAELETNPALRAEMQRLEVCIGRVGLDEAPAHFDPPVDLAVRTCRLVANRREQAVVVTRQSWTVATPAGQSSMTWVNLLTVASVLVAGAAIFFPALNHSLVQAERAACQNNLRQVGFALHEYRERDPAGRLPQVELVGNRGVAGFYAPLLMSKQLILDSATFLCPSLARTRRTPTLHVPTPEEIDAANEELLRQYHETMGGDYGYNLGYREGDREMPPCNGDHCDYPLMTDAPSDSQPGRRSANHGGFGQNVLHGDGHIKFIRTVPCPELPDDPFYNLEGRVGAGLNRTDSCIGGGSDRP